MIGNGLAPSRAGRQDVDEIRVRGSRSYEVMSRPAGGHDESRWTDHEKDTTRVGQSGPGSHRTPVLNILYVRTDF